MNALLKTYRLRAGFYVTRDGEYRIVRRRPRIGAPMLWSVEIWSGGEQRWLWIVRCQTLKVARQKLTRLIEARSEEA